jgi:Uma2 family endonuclease
VANAVAHLLHSRRMGVIAVGVGFSGMKAVVLEVDPALLEERRRLGIDRWDEMWEGVLHMVPPPSDRHQHVGTELLLVLGPLAKQRGLVVRYETGVFRAGTDNDYRVPDLVFAEPARRAERGIEGGAELVVEIRSPGDESYAKLSWYAALGVREMLVVDPATMAAELFRGVESVVTPVTVGSDGVLTSDVLGTGFATVDDRLRVTWDGGWADIAVD